MRTIVQLAWLGAAVLVAAPASADDKAACLEAASKGQALRDQTRLVEAREQFRRCAAQQCPPMVVQDCGGWLADVEKSLPTVVITAKDGAGRDLFDVQVSVDGQPLPASLTGAAVPMNPGLHTFHFEARDGTRLDRQVLVKQGDKNQELAVVVAAPAAAAPAAATAAPTAPAPPAGTASPPHAGSAGPWRTIGWVLAGLGVAGVAVGSVFGIVSMNDKSSAHCDANNFCDPGPLDSGRNAANGASVGFIAGGVLLAGGLAIVLLAPSDGAKTGGLWLTPVVGSSGGGVAAAGSWR
jgi:hypothetical protein